MVARGEAGGGMGGTGDVDEHQGMYRTVASLYRTPKTNIMLCVNDSGIFLINKLKFC